MIASVEITVMLRFAVFFATALLGAGAVSIPFASAQVTDDPQAVAPVVYSDPPPLADPCAADARTSDQSPASPCATPAPAQDSATADDDAPMENEDDAPAYVPAEDYADDYAPYDYAPYDYWTYGWGWPYYGYYAPYWPTYGIAFYGGGRWYGHRGWRGVWHDRDGHGWHGNHDGHGWRGDHDGHHGGRYAGNGQTWNGAHSGIRDQRNTRATVPSASYYAAGRNASATMSRRAAVAPADSYRIGNTSRSAARAAGSHNPYWVTSMPSRGYAPNNSRANIAGRGGDYRTPHGYAPQRAYAPQHGYARGGYSMSRGAPAYRGGYSGHSAGFAHAYSGGGHSGGGAVHSSGGGHGSYGRAR